MACPGTRFGSARRSGKHIESSILIGQSHTTPECDNCTGKLSPDGIARSVKPLADIVQTELLPKLQDDHQTPFVVQLVEAAMEPLLVLFSQ